MDLREFENTCFEINTISYYLWGANKVKGTFGPSFLFRQNRFYSLCMNMLKGQKVWTGKRGVGYRSSKVPDGAERVLGWSGYKIAICYMWLFKFTKI